MKKFLFILFFVSLSVHIYAKKFTIMVSPEGDAANQGRTLADGYERGFTRQYAQALKEALEQDSNIRVIFSHENNETASQEHKANFANRLQVDLYLSINFYASEKPIIQIYYYQSAPFSAPINAQELVLYPMNKAYVKNQLTTCNWSTKWRSLNQYSGQLHADGPTPAPIKQLEGIIAPAFVLDMGAQKMLDVHAYIKPISQIVMDIAHE
jgi:N-acetylmuramoyl-L-alanine amidase